MRRRVTVVIALASLLASAPSLRAQRQSVLHVRLYDGAALSAADRTEALNQAALALESARIHVAWTACDRQDRGANPPGCDVILGGDELAVRLVRLDGHVSEQGRLPLGYSLIDTGQAGGTLATVYVNRVRWLAAAAGSPIGPVLGLAIAHELGHLLLGSRAHGRSGLMRAIWSRAEIERHDPDDWLFTSGEGAAMARALSRRHISSEPPPNR